jgi:histidinol-phosphate aminotransferase
VSTPLDYLALAAPGVRRLRAYDPGHDPGTLRRERGWDDLVELGSNENGLGPAPAVRAALAGGDFAWQRDPDPAGRRLKAVLSAIHGLEPGCFVLGNGSHELLVLLAETLCEPGDEVVYAQYGFAVFRIAALGAGAEPVEVPATAALGADPDGFIARFGPRTKLVYLANPNNPTGTVWDRATLLRVLAALPERAIFVLDEAYAELVAGGAVPNGMTLLADHPRLVVTRTFSKAYGLAGLRIGYAAMHPELARVLERTRLSFNVSLIGLEAARLALAETAHLARVRAWTERQRAELIAGLAARGLRLYPSPANFVLVDFGRPAAPIEAALLERRVVVRPMGGYGLAQHLRITVGQPEEHARLLAALDAALEAS